MPAVLTTCQKPDACNAAGFKCTVRVILSGLLAQSRLLPGSLADLLNRHTRACIEYRDSFLGMTNLGRRHELSQDGALKKGHCV